MKEFSLLYADLDETTSTLEKVALIARYVESAPPEDAAWAVYFLSGRRIKRLVRTSLLRELASDISGIPPWLLEECYETVGDLAETLALLLPEGEKKETLSLAQTVERQILPLRRQSEEEKGATIRSAWQSMGTHSCFVWNKLITGGFRVGVSQRLVIRALARASGLESALLAHRLMGDWMPSAKFFSHLISADSGDGDLSRPYPFFLAHPLEETRTLGDLQDWQVEWKWDGIRSQLIARQDQCFLWSRGEEMIGPRFPEVMEAASSLPNGTVLDGELLGWRDGQVLPFAELQKRIGRKKVTRRILGRVPVVLMAYDILEWRREDIRALPLRRRRKILKNAVEKLGSTEILTSPRVRLSDWSEAESIRRNSRTRGVEGLMLKHRESPYRVGRKRGDWWKWKVDPYTVDAVLIYAQRGHGRRASLYSDYTFGVWRGDELVPFAKAYSGLTDQEIREVDRFVRNHTIDRFGPVRSVERTLVFEVAFEDIRTSNRHKSGLAVRFPRMVRWRRDKSAREADSLETVRQLLETKPILNDGPQS